MASNKLIIFALFSSMAWFMFWVVMAPVEKDIAHIFNWYFFMKLGHEGDFYRLLANIHYWLPLLLLCLAGLARFYPSTQTPVQVVSGVSACYNCLILLYLLLAGGKVTSLFLLTLPLRLVLSLGPWINALLLPQRLFIPVGLLTSLHLIFSRKPENNMRITTSALWRRVLVIVGLPLIIGLFSSAIMYKGCQPCFSFNTHDTNLPPRPRLISHRGCGEDNPENSITAFQQAIIEPQVFGLETDVQISSDGTAFLLHDRVPARTTDIREKCPSVDPWVNASTLPYRTGECSLEKLDVGVWFHKKHKVDIDPFERLPTFSEFLKVAKQSGKVIIFDVMEPPVGHPYHKVYLNITLETIIQSGIDHSKVWWLPWQNRDWVISHYPHITHITKTKETLFENFEANHILRINDDWTIPLDTFRSYQAANISINMYFVDSPFMYSYAWCVGVESVTTDHCQDLASITTNPLHEVCVAWWVALQLSSLWAWAGLIALGLLIILLFCSEKLVCAR